MKLEKLDFKVKKVKLIDEDGLTSSFYATRRTDTGLFLGVVGKNYGLIQNDELLEFCERICNQTGYEVFLEDVLSKGKKTVLSIKTGDVKVADDTIISQISVTNSFDRSCGVHFSFCDLTLRCANQFSKIVKNSNYSFEHNANLLQNIEVVVSRIESLNVLQANHYKALVGFTKVKMSKDSAIKKIAAFLEVSIDDKFKPYPEVSTRKANQFDNFVRCYEKEEVDLGNTVYTFYNASTRYVTHNLKQVFTGKGLKISNRVYDFCTLVSDI